MAENLVYHWKHGWIPLTHAAALSKAKGNSKLADRYVHGASLHGDHATAGKSARQIHAGLGQHAKIMARPATYRGVEGHNITGTDTKGRKVAVFVPGDRHSAQHAIDNLHAGRPAFEGHAATAAADHRPAVTADVHAARTTATHSDSEKRAQVEHSGDGTLLTIDRSDSEARAAAKAAGFKFSSNLGQWYLPRNWSESTRRQKVSLLQNALGREHVHVADSGPGSTLTAAEREAETRSRAADRAVRMDSRAKRAATEADVRFGRAHAIGDMIPFGQPILVGHHSEGRHRRDLARIDTNMRKGFEAHQEAGAAQAAADRARATAAGDSPLLRQRRIDRNEAELRKVEKQLKEHEIGLKLQKSEKYQSVSRNARGMVDSMVASPDYHAQLTARQAELRDQINHDKSQIEASGHKAIGQADLSPGDLVIYRGSPHVVKKVNKTTISVPTGYSWDDKLPINQITKHVKLADIPTSTIQGALANEKDPKVRHHYIAELNRRGIKATATN